MAVPAPNGPQRDHKGRILAPEVVIEADSVMELVAKLYGLGFQRNQIAASHTQLLGGDVKAARQKLRRWELKDEFRDLVWKHAVVKLDLETPQILKGISRAAKRGRVDAAKLALAIAKRHTDHSEMPQTVELRLIGVERPNRAAIRPRGGGELPPASTTDEDQ